MFVLFAVSLLILIVGNRNSKSGATAQPVSNYETQLRNRLNQIDRRDEYKQNDRGTVNRVARPMTARTNCVKYLCNGDGLNQLRLRQNVVRAKRQFDFNIDADHEEGVGTDVVASINANLYKSMSGETRLDGTARYSQHFGDYAGYGKTKFGGSLHLIHNYH